MNLESKMRFLIGTALVTFVMAAGVFAAPPGADIAVSIDGPADQYVYTPYVYTVTAENVGNRHANGVDVEIELPVSANSPTAYVLGRVSSIDQKCSLSGTKINCSFGRVRKGQSDSASFTFVMPVSTRTLGFTATSNSNDDNNASNNVATKTLVPKYNDLIINGTADVINQHCTGSTTLSSFYECVLAPTSVTDHQTTLNGNGTISFQIQGYTGTWSQPTPKELVFSYEANNAIILNFHGYAVSGNCFEGLSTFPNNPNYVSPYKVCIQ